MISSVICLLKLYETPFVCSKYMGGTIGDDLVFRSLKRKWLRFLRFPQKSRVCRRSAVLLPTNFVAPPIHLSPLLLSLALLLEGENQLLATVIYSTKFPSQRLVVDDVVHGWSPKEEVLPHNPCEDAQRRIHEQNSHQRACMHACTFFPNRPETIPH